MFVIYIIPSLKILVFNFESSKATIPEESALP